MIQFNTTAVTSAPRESIGVSSVYVFVPVLICIWLLILATFSPPEAWKEGRFGVSPVLPPEILKLMKLVSRAVAYGLITFSLFSVWRQRRRSFAVWQMFPLIAFAGFGLLSTTWSPLKTISLTQSASFALLILIATYIAIVWKTSKDTEFLVAQLGLASLVMTVVLISLHFLMPSSGSLTKDSAGVLHSTNASATAGLGILLTVTARLLWNSRWSVWWPLILGAHLSTMLIGGNRLSILVTAVTASALVLCYGSRIRIAFAVLFMSFLGAAYLAADPGMNAVKEVGKQVGAYAVQGQKQAELASLSGREEMWLKMWKSFQDSPVFGHGYFVTSAKGSLVVWYKSFNWTAHSLWLQILTTTGAFGLALLLSGFAWLSMGVWRGARTLDNVEPSVVLIAIVGCWIAGWSLLNTSFLGPLQPESVVFAVTVGIAAGVGASAAQVRRKFTDSSSSHRTGTVS